MSGLNELVVYDPGTHERGLPAVQLMPNNCGNLGVEIPPAVHVHRYYYNGDKEFQGPIIQGGPTIVVANHPDNPGCTLYIRVNLPSGAPRNPPRWPSWYLESCAGIRQRGIRSIIRLKTPKITRIAIVSLVPLLRDRLAKPDR